MTISYKSTGALLQAVRLAKKNPTMRFNVPGDFPLTSEDIIQNFRKGVMKRCNRGLHMPDESAFVDMQYDARVINEAAMRIRRPGRNLLRTPRLIARYPHIHNPSD